MPLEADEFTGAAVDGRWTFTDPIGDCAITVADGMAQIAVPAGVAHHTDAGSLNDAPYIWQDAGADPDFDVQVKFNSSVYANPDTFNLSQGLICYGPDGTDRVFCYLYNTATVSRVFVAQRIGGNSTTHRNAAILGTTVSARGNPSHLRLVKAGDVWTVLASGDGIVWTEQVSFGQPFTPARVGVLAANINHNAPFTSRVDWFHVGEPSVPDPPAVTATAGVEDDFAGVDGDPPDPARWVVDSQGETGEATLQGGTLRLRHGPEAGSRGGVYSVAEGSNLGTLLRYRFSDTDGPAHWFVASLSAHHTAAVSGGGGGEPEGFGDPFSPQWGYVNELGGANHLARPFRIDDADGSDPYDVRTYAQMGEVPAASQVTYRWLRMERIEGLAEAGGLFRFRTWADGDPEPSAWDFQGWDGVHEGPGRLYIGYANNATGSGPPTRDVFVDTVTVYELEAETEPPDPDLVDVNADAVLEPPVWAASVHPEPVAARLEPPPLTAVLEEG